jgi:hypothetical protein
MLFAFPLNQKTILDISRTYGYYQGQLYTLNTIKEKYPKLANKVEMAKIKFDLSFGDSIKNLNTIMNQYEKWKSIKKDIVADMRKRLNLNNMSYQEADNFIHVVEKRAEGKIESPVLETLLMLKPDYESHPEKEFYDGFKKRYTCDDFKKSKGIDFLIDIPISWASKKANRPNIVRKFIAQNGYESTMAMILVLELPDGETFSENDVKSAINREYMEASMPPNAKLKDYGFIVLETLPGYWQRYSLSAQRLRETLTMEVLAYTLFYKDKLIQIQFQVVNSNNKDINQKFKKYEPLFDSIINSFVLTDLYKNKKF